MNTCTYRRWITRGRLQGTSLCVWTLFCCVIKDKLSLFPEADAQLRQMWSLFYSMLLYSRFVCSNTSTKSSRMETTPFFYCVTFLLGDNTLERHSCKAVCVFMELSGSVFLNTVEASSCSWTHNNVSESSFVSCFNLKWQKNDSARLWTHWFAASLPLRVWRWVKEGGVCAYRLKCNIS